jgi:NAD(P)-dependent dehydrogenase (short-subunit alcohol dehydrogenase family)
MRLGDKVAIVTGGANGIGEATCRLFAREGAKVVVADISLEGAIKLAEELKSQGSQALAVKLDHTIPEEAEQVVNTTLDKFGQVDILVNVAGGSVGKFIRDRLSHFYESSKKEWDKIIDVNLTGPRNCTRAVINHMIGRKYGKIINFSSTVGMLGSLDSTDYAAAKAGIIGFTRCLALEVSCYGINVNCIAPGIVATQRILSEPKEVTDRVTAAIKFARMATPEEIGNVVLFLASDESSYITGENIPVAGGKDLG